MGIEQAIDRLYISAHQYRAFTIDELSALVDIRINPKKLRSLFIGDKRFVHLSEIHIDIDHFIVDSTLFKWLCSLNHSLSQAGIFKLSDHQFASKLSSLRSEDRWNSSPIKVIKWGETMGLVCPYWEKKEYVFPLAHVFFSMKKDTVETAYEVLTEFCNRRIWASKLLSKDIEYYIKKGFSQFEEQIAYIVKNREALLTGNKVTLQKLGKLYGLTRERIRQLEEKFWDSLHREKYKKPFIQAFLIDFFYSKGSLVLEMSSSNTLRRNFLAKCIAIPQWNLNKVGLIVQTFPIENKSYFDPKIKFPEEISSDTIGDRLESVGNFPLSKKDIKLLSEKTSEFTFNKLTLVQRVYLALRSIGRPAHYSEITDSHNSLWPDKSSSAQNIHNMLVKQRSGIVWIGIKGTYALKEWGYERPSMTLFETTAEIVKRKFKELSAPVPFTVIAAEIGKYRKKVVPSSIAIATYCNPDLVKVGKDSFIPKEKSQKDYKELALDELDKKFKEFQEKRIE